MSSAAVRNIMVRVGADTRPLSQGMDRAKKVMQRSTTQLKSVAGTVALTVGAAFAAMAAVSVKSAMEYESSMQQVNRIFGNNSKVMEDWAKNNAILLNMSRNDAVKYSSIYGNLISGIAKDTKQNAELTQTLMKQSAVVASATGRTMEDVMDRIRSGLLGNTEAIEDLGINVNVAMLESTDAFKKFANGKSWQQLDFQTQQQIRLMAILEQSMTKFGSEVSQNTNSSLAQLNARLANVNLNIGQAFKPIVDQVIPYLIEFAKALEVISARFSQFMQALFGVPIQQKEVAQTGTAATKAEKKLGTALGNVNKKTKGAVAGFDEINELQEKIADSGAGATDGLESMADTLSGNVDTKINVDIGENPFTKWAESIKKDFGPSLETIKKSFTNLGNAIISLWNSEAFSNILKFLGSIAKTESKAMLYALAGAFDMVSGAIKILNGVLNLDFEEAFSGVEDIVSGAWKAIESTTIAFFGPFIPNIEKWLSQMGKAFEQKYGLIKNTVKSYNDETKLEFMDFIDVIIDGWIRIGAQIAGTDQTLADFKDLTWDKFLNDVKWSFIGWGNDLKSLWDGFWAAIGQKWESFSGEFTYGWDRYWSGVGQGWREFWNGIKSMFVEIVNGIIDIINTLIRAWNKLEFTTPRISLPDWMGGGSWGGQTIGVPILREFKKIDTGSSSSVPSGTTAFIGKSVGDTASSLATGEIANSIASAVGTAVLQAQQQSSNSGQVNATLKIDGTTIARTIIPLIQNELSRIGNRAVIQTN